jgi:antitoxin (DNA-binding transcriptional repressor) of toxin-antitoxin stability system
LPRLIDRVLSGEEVVITRKGRPVLKLTPVEPAKVGPRRLGALEGQFRFPASFFFDPLPDDILEGFYGGKEGLETVGKLAQEEAERHEGKKG